MERKLTAGLKTKDLNVREHIAIQVLPILLATAADCDDPKEICKEAVSIAETLIETLNEDLR
jgi:hypothetical protein